MEYWFYIKDYSVALFDNYTSVLFVDESYFGGAHGGTSIVVDNFDNETGIKLTLDNLLGDPAIYGPVVNAALNKQLAEKGLIEIDITNPMDDFGTPFTVEFQIQKDGINFIFNEYTVGPYVVGITEILVPYTELGDLMQKLPA